MGEPLVSIGMPVYNGEDFVGAAVESLLQQQYQNFELIISDNASTDSTPQICRTLAEQCERISYSSNSENIGYLENCNRVAKLAQGDYFIWAGADDLWHPGFIAQLLPVALANPDLALVCCGVERIAPNGEHLYYYNQDHPDTGEMERLERIKTVLRFSSPSAIAGLINTRILSKTDLLRYDTYPTDMFLLAELSIWGGIKCCPQILFYKRDGGLNKRRNEGYYTQSNKLKKTLRAVDALTELDGRERSAFKYELLRSYFKTFCAGIGPLRSAKDKIQKFAAARESAVVNQQV